ncbi:hypothetical protein M446_1840 [Methylobacterium sp. 4-46]|nr:hypothetical protein M446_1840 [Methylobacterium sp. 4-46]
MHPRNASVVVSGIPSCAAAWHLSRRTITEAIAMIVSATAFLAALIGLQGILVVKLADRLTPGPGRTGTAERPAVPANGRYVGIA